MKTRKKVEEQVVAVKRCIMRVKFYDMLKHCAVVISSPLGSLLAIADNDAVRFLQIATADQFTEKIDGYQRKLGVTVVFKDNLVLDLLQQELELCFSGNLQQFTVSVAAVGTVFQ